MARNVPRKTWVARQCPKLGLDVGHFGMKFTDMEERMAQVF